MLLRGKADLRIKNKLKIYFPPETLFQTILSSVWATGNKSSVQIYVRGVNT